MATVVKKGGLTSKPQLFFIGKQFPGNATYGEVFGDAGVIIKLLGARNDEKLIRLYGITKWDGKKSYECNGCGAKFTSESFRSAHGKLRHSPKVIMKEFSELTERQRQQVLADTERYETGPGDFNVPDPEDRAFAAQERQLMQSIEWDKTAASNRT